MTQNTSLTRDMRLSAQHRSGWLAAAKWIGTATGVGGAALIALNLGLVAYGFVFFLFSSLLWAVVGRVQCEPGLLALQSTFTAINLLGMWRWALL